MTLKESISKPVAFIIGTLALILMASCAKEPDKDTDFESQLRSLDAIIKQLPAINQSIEVRLDSLAELYREADGTAKIERALELAEQFRLFNADSSLYYATMATEIAGQRNKPHLENMARLERVTTLATLGIFSDAQEEFRAVKIDTTSYELKQKYFYAGRTLYGYMSGYLTDNSEFYEEARRLYRMYDDSLISVLPDDSYMREFLIGEKLSTQNRYNEAAKVDLRLLAKLDSDTRIYAMTAFQLATCYRMEGESEKMACYLAKAAEGDLKAGIRDGLALPMLASYLYSKGEIDQAYRYINISLQYAATGGMRWRAYAIALLVPGIDEAYHASMAATRKKLLLYAVISTLCLIVAVVLLRMVYRQRKQLHDLAIELDKKAKLQTSYIGNFVAMCATYAERLNHLTGVVDRKLAAGDIDSLRKMMKTGKFLEGEDEDFYRIFDSAFLDIYPDFVTGLNELLREEERLSWKKNKPLTPELRIYALVRLGVSESTRIAQILHYSVSTVYAYRNRMRNRAINRDDFEKDVVSISAQNIPVA